MHSFGLLLCKLSKSMIVCMWWKYNYMAKHNIHASSLCLKWCPTTGASLFRIISSVISGNRLLIIDNSTPVSQSRQTLRFQSIACHSTMRCPHVLTRPEMVWQAFVQDIASGQLAVFDMAENPPGKRNCCYGQCKSDEQYPVKCAGVTF